LTDAVLPAKWEPPSHWYYAVKDELQVIPHTLGYWVDLHFGITEQNRHRVEGVLNASPEGQWVHLPLPTSSVSGRLIGSQDPVPPARRTWWQYN
jgi:hypothetical protein